MPLNESQRVIITFLIVSVIYCFLWYIDHALYNVPIRPTAHYYIVVTTAFSWVSHNLLMGYCYMNLGFIPYILNIHSIAIRCDLCLNLPISKVNKDLEIVYFGSEIIIYSMLYLDLVYISTNLIFSALRLRYKYGTLII